ncbi:CPBP family glutamic-type intramembrane protease [Natrinema ejinorense]|uniref:CPBP family intramembrane metalloprotease domain-containing protein n=1 Tax=Natrinema ejinorense TaxID=373386 RepID=A0A2A5QZY0_9EURY|nr:CPBP family glutamic-type intramembrane protease [Natrinema ejinorense]PCR92323.1 CPBP family intramembrane metalloprotease domain-containing protein [Natrinema ejinorense]
MPQWATFVGITGVVLVVLLVLSHLTQSAFSDGPAAPSDEPEARADASFETDSDATPTDSSPRPHEPPADADGDGSVPENRESDRAVRPAEQSSTLDPAHRTNGTGDERTNSTNTPDDESNRNPATASDGSREGPTAALGDDRRGRLDRDVDPDSLSTGMVLANVAFSQGLFALVLLGAAVYTAIPPSALGIDASVSALETGLRWGIAVGVVVYVGNELAAAAATHLGFDHDEDLRELLAPDSTGDWLLLLGGVLPIIAVFEEFLFRAALIGVPAAGFGLSPWLLAVGSSIAFALGHGMQGSIGIVVTGLLGFVLAVVFIVTGSLLVVVVAHYLVNALEFVVHEGIGLEWAETLEG